MNRITGLHHVTALCSDAQQNIDFYAGILGMRIVKRTVNFDALDVYHLYYGNEQGDPGTILTFFPYPGMPKGRKGTGQLTITSFSVPRNSLDYWMKRLASFGVSHTSPEQRFDDETSIYFEDNDGLGLELVANNSDERPGYPHGHIPPEFAIKGFYGVLLTEDNFEITARLLTGQMDHRLVAQRGNRYRFTAGVRKTEYVDILDSPGTERGRSGAGTIHHVAFATPDDSKQLELRTRLIESRIVAPTDVIDRQYFHSVYFREPGGVLFEAATSDMGFTIDEPLSQLGQSLRLPAWEEKNRSDIESLLEPLSLDVERFSDAHVRHS